MEYILEARHLCKEFILDKDWRGRVTQTVRAVDDVSLGIPLGRTVGLVGESGCGKSTFGRTLLGLYSKTSGEVLFKGDPMETPDQLQQLRQSVQMIFQDPYASLNPRMTVDDIIGEPLIIHKVYARSTDRRQRVKELLELVSLTDEQGRRYPHEFSGGQRQRIGIARALALNPLCLICDEPISALDVSIQVQVVNILQELQQRLGIAMLFIAHDLAMVQHISHQIGVMYLGRLVELGDAGEVYHHPQHPYTRALIDVIPRPNPHIRQHRSLVGEVPSPLDPPSGCPFHPRCPQSMIRCRQEVPVWRLIGENHFSACHAIPY